MSDAVIKDEYDEATSDNDDDDSMYTDTCTSAELNNLFKEVYQISDEKSHRSTKAYILHMCNDDSFNSIAAGLSDRQLKVLDINTKKSTFTTTCNCIHLKNYCNNSQQEDFGVLGVRYLDTTGNTLLTATTDGVARLFDCRAGVEQQSVYQVNRQVFKSIPKGFLCFDRNANSRILCMGTEQKGRFAYLLFFDIRSRKMLGAYHKGHSSEVTSLRFHPDNPDILISGSTDGLINIYNLQKPDEQQAIFSTINTESSVDRLNWHKNVYAQDIISCLTHTGIKMYEYLDSRNIIDLEREQLAKAMQRSTFYDINIVNTHGTVDGGVFLLAGTNSCKGNVLRSLKLENRQASPLANFVGNNQIVRDSLYNEKYDVLATGGENAVVTLWSAPKASETSQMNTLKIKSISKFKNIRSGPY